MFLEKKKINTVFLGFCLNKDDIFATEAIKPSQKSREKERTFEPNLFDDNIDIFADLTVKPKEKSKKKVEAKSIFDDDMGKFDFLYDIVITVQWHGISPATFI